MSTISLITFLVLSISAPTYTEIIQKKDVHFYRQKGNFFSITNISTGQKNIGITNHWGNFSVRMPNTNTGRLKLAVGGFQEVKKQIAQNKFDENNCKYYENIIDNSAYSDSLAYAFLCWRTSYQMSNYGVSNFSIIPNNLYNRKKMIVINKLKRYLKSHPYSINASQQMAYLENLSDIVRGGFMGSSVLTDLVFLSGD